MDREFQPPTASRSEDWERLRRLLDIASTRGLKALSEDELRDLPGFYRKAISDLSLLRTTGAHPSLLEDLNLLCNRAHAVIYRGMGQRRQAGAGDYLLRILPGCVRRRFVYVLAAALVMTLFAAVGWVHCTYDYRMAEVVLSPQMVGGIKSNLEYARQQADLGLAAQIPREDRNGMAVLITVNNIGVSVRAFAFGILGGLPALIILGFNGYMLGAIGFLYFNTSPGIDVNLPLYFMAGIAPHGFIELSAISIAGAAGMLIGFAWVFPGQRSRGDALRDAARDGGRLVLVCAITLVVAGAIEGFVTPLLPPAEFDITLWYWIKIAIGSAVFLIWLAWLTLGGRRLARSVAA
jgi:uncharacterized membrane protein SpoIIM required for sporulation